MPLRHARPQLGATVHARSCVRSSHLRSLSRRRATTSDTGRASSADKHRKADQGRQDDKGEQEGRR